MACKPRPTELPNQIFQYTSKCVYYCGAVAAAKLRLVRVSHPKPSPVAEVPRLGNMASVQSSRVGFTGGAWLSLWGERKPDAPLVILMLDDRFGNTYTVSMSARLHIQGSSKLAIPAQKEPVRKITGGRETVLYSMRP